MTAARRSPAHLSPAAQRLWKTITSTFVMEDHDLAVLTKALEALGRADQARAAIDHDGLLVTSRFGEQRPHPLLGVERDSRAAFLAGMRQLRLDYEPVTNQVRTAAARAARWERDK